LIRLNRDKQSSSDEQVYDYLSASLDLRLQVGSHLITSLELQEVCAYDGWLTDSVIDAYLCLLQNDFRTFDKLTDCKFYIKDTLTSRYLATRPATEPFRPYGAIEMRDFWITEVLSLVFLFTILFKGVK